MTTRIAVTAALLLLAALPTRAVEDPFAVIDPLDYNLTHGLDDDELGVRDDEEPRPRAAALPPPPPPSAAQVEEWRRVLTGVPVYGERAGEIGRVDGLVVDLDGRVTGIVVAVGPARVPMPWRWVERQVGRPTLVVPYSRQDVDWLMGDTGR